MMRLHVSIKTNPVQGDYDFSAKVRFHVRNHTSREQRDTFWALARPLKQEKCRNHRQSNQAQPVHCRDRLAVFALRHMDHP